MTAKKPPLDALPLDRILAGQGFGSRRSCRTLIRHGCVTVRGDLQTDPDQMIALAGLVFTVNQTAWQYRERVVLMLHKPAGMECSRNPNAHASVFELLPPPLIARGVQPVGRLDQDTTGLLLLTDDGGLNHRLTAPRHHVPKRYLVSTKHPLNAAQIAQLLAGVVLHDAPQPVSALGATQLNERTLSLSIAQGKYHQVKRMLAAVGNRVEALHRSQIGGLVLPDDLAPGTWRYLSSDVLHSLTDHSAF